MKSGVEFGATRRGGELLSRLAAVAVLVALFVGGSQPQAAGLIPAPWDKLAHVAVFGVLTLSLARGFSLPPVWAGGVAALFGIADELHQSSLPGRVAGVEDLLADLAGIALALAVLHWQRRAGMREGRKVGIG
ncbi:VanZ family protein [Azoarcus sp. PA01]|nr:VanZ family protein [Azoarcus sp. PA01]